MPDPLLPVEENSFQKADEVIWEKLLEYNVLDEILAPLRVVPKWAKIQVKPGKQRVTVTGYAHPDMSDEEAMEKGYSMNPDWLSVRRELRPLVMKYQVSRSAAVTKDETVLPKALSEGQQRTLEAEVIGKVLDLKVQRDKAAIEQAQNLKNLKKRSG